MPCVEVNGSCDSSCGIHRMFLSCGRICILSWAMSSAMLCNSSVKFLCTRWVSGLNETCMRFVKCCLLSPPLVRSCTVQDNVSLLTCSTA